MDTNPPSPSEGMAVDPVDAPKGSQEGVVEAERPAEAAGTETPAGAGPSREPPKRIYARKPKAQVRRCIPELMLDEARTC